MYLRFAFVNFVFTDREAASDRKALRKRDARNA
jgi:hypothetical protein